MIKWKLPVQLLEAMVCQLMYQHPSYFLWKFK